MKNLTKTIATILIITIFSACSTTRYSAKTNESSNDIRFSGPTDKEEVVRQVKISKKEHYFLMGLISGSKDRDVNELANLSSDEKLVNTRIENEQSFVDGLLAFGGCLLTLCIVSPFIWSTRTTELTGNVVRAKVAAAPAAKAAN